MNTDKHGWPAAVLLCGLCWAQTGSVDPYSTGMTLGFPKACPVLVIGVWPKSPAATAGIKVGDHLEQVDGKDIARMSARQVSSLLRSDDAGKVAVVLSRGGKDYTATIERQRFSSILERNGQKSFGGVLLPLDSTEAEAQRLRGFDGKRLAARVFPSHYPADPALYYGGFEVMIMRDPEEFIVTGVEEGPASRAGVHQGDGILSVNGTDLAGRPPPSWSRSCPARDSNACGSSWTGSAQSRPSSSPWSAPRTS